MNPNYTKLREELRDYYWTKANDRSRAFYEECMPLLDAQYNSQLTPFEMKRIQYRLISDRFEPLLFEHSPFYYEMGTLAAHSDGARNFRGHKHPGGWTYWKNEHRFQDQDPELWKKRCAQAAAKFYLICGPYNDTSQHFQFYLRPIFEFGLKGVYEKATNALQEAQTADEKEFLQSVCESLLCVKKISEKFADRAETLAKEFPKNENYRRIAVSARRCPWEKPQSFYEALNVCALMRKVIGSLEGIGPNSFGRLDMDLFPFYQHDLGNGTLTKESAYELICQFLITWDCHYDHDMKMVGYADHELENTYVLGGCDTEGNTVCNDLTLLFLRATQEEKIIFPKIKCRFSKNSPKEYLDAVNTPISQGTSTVILLNDDSLIPAMVRSGKSLEDARDYLCTGCWGVFTNGNDAHDDANYTNLLKVLEYQIYQPAESMRETQLFFDPIDDAESFEEVYRITLENCLRLFRERIDIGIRGGQIWHKVDPLPLFSSTYVDCIGKKKDFTQRGARYNNDVYMCVGFPNIIDSLLAIKTLCFDQKKYSLSEFLSAVRNNWENAEKMRADALRCPGWGDGSDTSCTLAARFHSDLYQAVSAMKGIYGGTVTLAHHTYTEIRFWGEQTLATPDGRRNGDYFSQGLTPSRLKKIPNVTDVITSLSALDKTEMGGSNVVNIILPGKTPLNACEAFLRATATSALGSLQLNCVSRETLLDAQKNPEKYPDLIVRVCGFSAKFSSLTPEWQQEVLSRNFYE